MINRAISHNPDSFELLAMAGRLAYLEKQPKDSADALAQADKIKPLAARDRMTLALAFGFSGRAPQARGEFLHLINAEPRNAEYPYLLGRLDVNSRHLEDAAREFSQALAIDPTMVRAYEELGGVQESLGLADAALRTYETGAARNRSNQAHWERPPLTSPSSCCGPTIWMGRKP